MSDFTSSLIIAFAAGLFLDWAGEFARWNSAQKVREQVNRLLVSSQSCACFSCIVYVFVCFRVCVCVCVCDHADCSYVFCCVYVVFSSWDECKYKLKFTIKQFVKWKSQSPSQGCSCDCILWLKWQTNFEATGGVTLFCYQVKTDELTTCLGAPDFVYVNVGQSVIM
jgi:hypothetical protein